MHVVIVFFDIAGGDVFRPSCCTMVVESVRGLVGRLGDGVCCDENVHHNV